MSRALKVPMPLESAVSALEQDTAKAAAVVAAKVATRTAETVLTALLDHVLPRINSAQELGHFSCQIEKAIGAINTSVDVETERDPIKLLQIITNKIKEGRHQNVRHRNHTERP